MTTGDDDDRIAYLSGEDGESLPARERGDLDELRALLGSPATWAEPDPALEDRVVASIAAEAKSEPARAEAEPARARRRRSTSVRLPRWRRPAYALAGLAAAAATAIVLAATLTTSSPAPTRFAMVVSGTQLAPAAHGSATLTKTGSGWRIELSATGLPRLASGRFYEAWLKNPAGVLVPVGTFNDARNVTLWAGVPPTEFPSLTVTQQQANGNPASSGRRVLTGTIRARR